MYRVYDALKPTDGLGIFDHFPSDIKQRVIHFPVSRLVRITPLVCQREEKKKRMNCKRKNDKLEGSNEKRTERKHDALECDDFPSYSGDLTTLH